MKFSYFFILIICLACNDVINEGKSVIATGGGNTDISLTTGGSTLAVPAGTFGTDMKVSFGAVDETKLTTAMQNRNGTIALDVNDTLESAAEVLIGDGTSNVTLEKALTVSLYDENALASTQPATFRAASLPTNTAIFCQLYNEAGLGKLLFIETIDPPSGQVVTFSFGAGETLSGFLCMFISTPAGSQPTPPQITENGEHVVTGIGGE